MRRNYQSRNWNHDAYLINSILLPALIEVYYAETFNVPIPDAIFMIRNTPTRSGISPTRDGKDRQEAKKKKHGKF